ncbi:FMN-linked oxidoreductase [Backusella circina FSU 941]|nr:FMN-linked oxidoreductase [Backusella circina FSU 941]
MTATTHPDIDYSNKIVLAPMVRIGTLPMRLLALDYGADLVWTEELVDKRIIGSVRQVNHATGTIEYLKNGKHTFSTNDAEKGKVILQLGTADPDLALKAALTLKEDVSAVDLNCGCPKKFSVQGGMGAALLSNPDNLVKILDNLVKHAGMPVSCKIRLLPDQEETIKLVKKIVVTGIKALTVHCRTKDMRSTEKALWERLEEVIKAVKELVDIPVIVNGDVFQWSDVEKVKELTKADSVMIARGAQENPSAFRKEGLVSYKEGVCAYLRKCVDVDNMFQNTKYVILCMNTTDTLHTKSEIYREIQKSKTVRRICEIFDMADYYDQVQVQKKARLEEKESNKRERDNETNTIEETNKKIKTTTESV